MNLWHKILIIILGIFLAVFQVSFLESLPILKYLRPIFILIIVLTIKGDYLSAIIIAFLGGVIEDLTSVFPFGFFLLSNLLVIGILFYLRNFFDFTFLLGKIWPIVILFFIYKCFYFGLALLFSSFNLSFKPIFSWHLIINFLISLFLNTILALICLKEKKNFGKKIKMSL